MRVLRMLGSLRGALSNGRPYRDPSCCLTAGCYSSACFFQRYKFTSADMRVVLNAHFSPPVFPTEVCSMLGEHLRLKL